MRFPIFAVFTLSLLASCRTTKETASSEKSALTQSSYSVILRRHFAPARPPVELAKLECSSNGNGVECVQARQDNSPYYVFRLDGSSGALQKSFKARQVPQQIAQFNCENEDGKATCLEKTNNKTYLSIQSE